MYLLYAHHNVDGGVGDVSESTNHFWTSRGQQFFIKSDMTEVKGGHGNQAFLKKREMSP